jgi:exopolyphosphatase / guanosine-5'-triphosphate,3'-diphosphate pyrophosphatase
MPRASIDIGSNSVRLMVVDLGPPLRLLHDDGALTRMGDSLARSGAIEGPPLDATLAAVRRFAADARRLGAEPTCIATAGLRDATNAPAVRSLLAVAAEAPVRVISGSEEAALAFLGARAGTRAAPEVLAVLDVGGGSTEVAWGREGIRAGTSRPVGARKLLRLAPALASEAPIPAAALDEARGAARELLLSGGAIDGLPDGAPLYGMGGTITTVAALDLGLTSYEPLRVNDAMLTQASLRGACERLRRLSLAERRKALLEPDRADLLLPGAVIVEAALEVLARSELTVSIYSLRLGAITDAGMALLAEGSGEDVAR